MPDAYVRGQADDVDLDAGEDETRKYGLSHDAQFRLMLKLLSFERSEEDNGKLTQASS